jgi:integrase
MSIIEGLPKIGRYVFTTTGASPVSGFTRAKARIDRLMAEAANRDLPDGAEARVIPPFTIHDLRRTAATGMAGLRFPPHVVEAVLNHRSGTRRALQAFTIVSTMPRKSGRRSKAGHVLSRNLLG